jgi:hypothetical protein
MGDESGKFEVGYRKPPSEHRFRKGQSGNPNGRPKGSKNKPRAFNPSQQPTDSLVLEEAYRMVTIREGEKVIELPAVQAAVRSLAISAMKGTRRTSILDFDCLSSNCARCLGSCHLPIDKSFGRFERSDFDWMSQKAGLMLPPKSLMMEVGYAPPKELERQGFSPALLSVLNRVGAKTRQAGTLSRLSGARAEIGRDNSHQ